MEIWETASADLGSDIEEELQASGWEPFGVVYVPAEEDEKAKEYSERYFEVFYRRKREGLAEEL